VPKAPHTGLTPPASAGRLARTLGRRKMHTPVGNASSTQLRRPKCTLRQAGSIVGFPVSKPGLALIAPARTKATSNAACGVESARKCKFSASRRRMHMNISVGACAPTSANLQSVRAAAAVRNAVTPGQQAGARRVLRKTQPSLTSVKLRPNPSVNRTRYGRRRKAGAQRLRHCRAPALRRLPPRAGYLER
jgi:hypothetical protein